MYNTNDSNVIFMLVLGAGANIIPSEGVSKRVAIISSAMSTVINTLTPEADSIINLAAMIAVITGSPSVREEDEYVAVAYPTKNEEEYAKMTPNLQEYFDKGRERFRMMAHISSKHSSGLIHEIEDKEDDSPRNNPNTSEENF
tara:strand:- start:17633 stop:18061 length:429 start_codon:yes stop_codon:yes gene_type:complete